MAAKQTEVVEPKEKVAEEIVDMKDLRDDEGLF